MFGSIDTKVRPLKLAYLIEPNNAEQALHAIRLSSTLWGGTYFPVIPLYKRIPANWETKPMKPPAAKDVILGYLEGYDPDVLVQISNDVPDFVKNSGLEIIKPADIWKYLDDRSTPQFGIGLFEILNDVYEKFFRYKAKYPLKVVVPKVPEELSLFWVSMFGEMPEAVASRVTENYSEPLEIETIDFQVKDFGTVMAGNALFPRRMTQWALEPVHRSGFRRSARIFYMDATKVADIVDFWNLRAMGGNVLPLPKQIQADPGLRALIINFLKEHRRPWRHAPEHCDYASMIRSRNTTMEEMQEYAKTLKIARDPSDPSHDGFFSLQHWYPRVWDSWGRDKDGAIPDDQYSEDERTIEIADIAKLSIQFKPLLPKFAAEYGYSGQPRCANELSFRLYGSEEYLAEVFPKSSGDNFRHSISGLTSFEHDWRVGRNGLVKLVKDEFSEHRDIPAAENIVFAWLKDKGWQPTLSPPGLLAKQMFKQLRGYPGIFANERLLGLLEYMNGGRVKQDGTPVEENTVGQERDLAIAEVKGRLQEATKRGALHDFLLERGIFRLGLRVQCPKCLRRSWLSMGNIRDSFACPRCLNSFPALGNIDNSTWSYKTTGPFSVPNYADGAYAVLFTLDFFDDRKLTTLRTTSAVSFTAESKDKQRLEADLALFWQESLFGERKDGIAFGECKTYGSFMKKDFDRMRYIAKTFPGAVLVFSTLRKSLTSKEVTAISRLAKAGRKYWKADHPLNPVLILTGTELLHWQKPPYCWDEATKKKFERYHGLLSLCDATQQIYLGLPSWHVDWQKQWEEKRRRRGMQKKADVPAEASFSQN